MDFYTNSDGLFRQQFLDEFRPLDEARAAAVEIFVAANVAGFPQVLDAVEVEVKDLSRLLLFSILIHYGEGG